MLRRYFRQPEQKSVNAPAVVEEYDFCDDDDEVKPDVLMSDATFVQSDSLHDEVLMSADTDNKLQGSPMMEANDNSQTVEENENDSHQDGEILKPASESMHEENAIEASLSQEEPIQDLAKCTEHEEDPTPETPAMNQDELIEDSVEMRKSEHEICETSATPEEIRSFNEEELAAASLDLQNTLASNNHSLPESSTGPTYIIPTEEELEEASRTLQTTFANNPSSSRTDALVGQAAGPNSAVSYCLNLFQQNPDVQAAVISLARDPAVWDAFVQNEKVQELMSQTRRRKRFRFEGENGNFLEQSPKMNNNPFLVAMQWIMVTVWGVMDTLSEVVHGVFGYMDSKLFGTSSDATDTPVKACMVLTILLLSLILVSR